MIILVSLGYSFLREKSEVQGIFKKFARRAQNEFDAKIKRVRSDNGTEFKNTNIEEFLDEEGIKHEFSVPYTPQRCYGEEQPNAHLSHKSNVGWIQDSNNYWAKAVSIAYHAINRLYLHKKRDKTTYDF